MASGAKIFLFCRGIRHKIRGLKKVPLRSGERRRIAEFFLSIAHQTQVGLPNVTVCLSACQAVPAKPAHLSTAVSNVGKAAWISTNNFLPKAGIVCLTEVSPRRVKNPQSLSYPWDA